MARAYYGSKLSDNMAETPEGFLICKNVPIARTGPQDYRGTEFGMKDSGIYKVTRPPTEVFTPAAIASFEGKPVCNEHPPEDVMPDNYKRYMKGTVRDVRQGTGEFADCLLADIIIYDEGLKKAIRNGKREISCGYDCLWVETGDKAFEQRDIRGNHVAIVSKGRAGHKVAIRDTKEQLGGKKMAKNGILSRMFASFARDEATSPEDLMEASKAVNAKTEDAEGGGDDPKKPNDLEERLSKIEDSLACLAKGRDFLDVNNSNGNSNRLGGAEDEDIPKEKQEVSEVPEEEDQTALDSLEEELTNNEEDPQEINGQAEDEDADFIPPDTEEQVPGEETQAARDSALECIRNLKPLVASMPNKVMRRRAADSLAMMIRGQVRDAQYTDLLNAKRASAARDSAPSDSDLGKAIRDQFNPHYKK